MAVSLGMRVSGLLLAGAVAVAAAAFTGGGRDTPDRGYGGGGVVTGGPSSPAPTGHRAAPLPSPTPARPSPDGHAHTPDVTDSPHGPVSPSPSPSPAPSPGQRLLQSPPWLPPGPNSPNTDGIPDPSSGYDRLRDPAECRAVLDGVPAASADPEWRLLRGLASACLAVQGKGGSWASAAEAYTALAGRADTCKGRAAYTVLGGLLDFHRRHPGGTVRLSASPGGATACVYRLAGVDTGGDGEALPGETVAVELTGVYFDPAELLRDGRVLIDGRLPQGLPVLGEQEGDRVVLDVVVPALDPGGLPKKVDVAVQFGGVEVRAEGAFTVVAPDVVASPTGSGTPTGVVAPEVAAVPSGSVAP
ncbi:hypothetical protein AQJ23_33940 [Streptomyces antibioticus]|nr:hypothetical protein [Streptomyces antibioticus]KUN20653.1 hypothetical protein AQJ23_33940 [Streptomyces antibioticus]